MVNTWTGYVGDLDSSGVISLKGIVKDDTMLVNSWREYLWDYYAGISVLEQGGKLWPLWDDIEEELIKRGKIAVLEYGESGEFFLADIVENSRNIANGSRKTTLTLIDNELTKFSTDPNKWKDETRLSGLSQEYLKLTPEKFVIFENNRQQLPYLGNFEYYAWKLVNVVRKMEMDMFMSEKKLMFMVEEQPEEEDMTYMINTYQKGIFFFPNFQYSSNPSKAGQKEGKTGINPHNVKFELYEPKTDFADRYIKKFNFWWDKLMMISGLRYDITGANQAESGAERATSGQVRASGRTFDAFEKRAWKARMKGITEFKSKFDPASTNYILVYGDYNKEHNKTI